MTQPSPLPDDPPVAAVPPAPAPPGRLRWVLAAGLAAGLASWLLGETPLVQPPVVEHEMTVMGHTFMSSTPQTRSAAADADAARFQGVFGATLGLMLGLAGGLSRRSPRAAATSALLGAAVGALCGLVALRVALPLYHYHKYTVPNDLITSLAMHGLPFTLAGAAGGLALGVGLGGAAVPARSILGGAVGALIGTIAAEFLGAVAFPASETGHPLAATAPARLLAPLIVAVLASLGALWAVTRRQSRKPVAEA